MSSKPAGSTKQPGEQLGCHKEILSQKQNRTPKKKDKIHHLLCPTWSCFCKEIQSLPDSKYDNIWIFSPRQGLQILISQGGQMIEIKLFYICY